MTPWDRRRRPADSTCRILPDRTTAANQDSADLSLAAVSSQNIAPHTLSDRSASRRRPAAAATAESSGGAVREPESVRARRLHPPKSASRLSAKKYETTSDASPGDDGQSPTRTHLGASYPVSSISSRCAEMTKSSVSCPFTSPDKPAGTSMTDFPTAGRNCSVRTSRRSSVTAKIATAPRAFVRSANSHRPSRTSRRNVPLPSTSRFVRFCMTVPGNSRGRRVSVPIDRYHTMRSRSTLL